MGRTRGHHGTGWPKAREPGWRTAPGVRPEEESSMAASGFLRGMARRLLPEAATAYIQNRAYLAMDAGSLLRHGPNAPRKYQLAYWPPAAITEAMAPDAFGWVDKDAVDPDLKLVEFSHDLIRDGDWDRQTVPVEARKTYQGTWQRIRGTPWEETEEFSIFVRAARDGRPLEGLDTRDAILRRYAALDRMIAELRRGGEIRPRCEFQPGFREKGGIGVAIARDGRVLFALSGNHRLAAATALGKEIVPVTIQHVHPGALASGGWARFRRESDRLGALHHRRKARSAHPAGATRGTKARPSDPVFLGVPLKRAGLALEDS
jgi:hypothetical protein